MIKTNLYKLFVLGIAMVLFASPVFAGDKDRVGTASATELVIPVGGEGFALGGSNISSTSGLDAIHWNPAGLSTLNGGSALFSTMSYMGDADIRMNYLALGYDAGWLVAGVFLRTLDVGDIPLTTRQDPYNATGATYNPTLSTIGLTLSKKMTDNIFFGFNLKFVNEDIANVNATAFAVDAGLQYRNLGGINNLDFGITIANIGPDLEFSGSGLLRSGTADDSNIPNYFYEIPVQSHGLPSNYQLGLGYTFRIDNTNTLRGFGTFVSEDLENDRVKVGLEYSFDSILFGRLGYQTQPDADADQNVLGLTAGVGIKYPVGGSNISFNYVYQEMKFVGDNNLFSLEIGF
jgi:opacity protein-like surface antigen